MKVCILGDARSVHVQRIVPGLAERGLDVRVVCHKPADIPGATVERFAVPGPSLRMPFRWNARWARYLRTLMRTHDVVSVHFLHDWGLTPEIIDEGALLACPWGSDIVPPPGEARPGPELVAKRVMMLQHAAAVTCWAPRFAQTVAEFAAINPADITILPLGVDLTLFRPPSEPGCPQPGPPSEPGCPQHGCRRQSPSLTNRTAHRSANGAYKVGFFKGFREVYGPTVLMRAIPVVLESLPATRFHLIGDGPMLRKCHDLARLHDVWHSIKWIRRQPHANMPNHLAGWDLSVIPSLQESFGAAAVESAAMKVPVVASNVGGLPDAVQDGQTGVLVPPGDADALADAIVRLLNDAPTRERMGLAGRRMAEERFNWNRILDEWVSTYERARDRVCTMV